MVGVGPDYISSKTIGATALSRLYFLAVNRAFTGIRNAIRSRFNAKAFSVGK